jgi:hypothetical protein
MSALQRIAYHRHRRDEGPNQELAGELTAKKDRTGIREIAEKIAVAVNTRNQQQFIAVVKRRA